MFYFILSGKIEVVVDHNDNDFKFSKLIDENEIFGFKQNANDIRLDYARGAATQ